MTEGLFNFPAEAIAAVARAAWVSGATTGALAGFMLGIIVTCLLLRR